MTEYLSFEFDEDLHRDDLERFKTIPGCIGVSGYRNTINLYFEKLSRHSLYALATVIHEQLVLHGMFVNLSTTSFDSSASRGMIYEALQEEAAS